jgi:hypothetical protein
MTDEIEETTEQKEECPLCQIAPILMGIGAAHTACATVEDPEQKSKCMSWVDDINPEEIKSAEEIFSAMLENAGIEAVDRAAKAFNLGIRNAVVNRVGKKLNAGEKVSDPELATYKQLMLKERV